MFALALVLDASSCFPCLLVHVHCVACKLQISSSKIFHVQMQCVAIPKFPWQAGPGGLTFQRDYKIRCIHVCSACARKQESHVGKLSTVCLNPRQGEAYHVTRKPNAEQYFLMSVDSKNVYVSSRLQGPTFTLKPIKT